MTDWHQRATFWLVAAVLGVHGVVILVSLGVCSFYGREIVVDAKTCGEGTRLFDLMGAMLSAALAFAAGRASK